VHGAKNIKLGRYVAHSLYCERRRDVVLDERENIEIVKPCWIHLNCAMTVGIGILIHFFNLMPLKIILVETAIPFFL
jgi:hypothetical protein